jgi:leucyl-tRNA synthetase
MVMPQRKNWYGKWVDDKYDASKHSIYAEDLQGAKFMHIYQSVVFFYQVYRNWIEVSQGYLIQEMIAKGMDTETALKVVQTLCETLDGNIVPNLLPTKKILQLTKLMS